MAAPVREIGDVMARTLPYAQLPTDAPTRASFFCSQVAHFSRDLSCWRTGYYVLHPFSTRRILCSDVASWAWTSRTPKIHRASRQLKTTAVWRYDVPRDWFWDACHRGRVCWGTCCEGLCCKEDPHYQIEQRVRNPLERDQVQRALGNCPKAVIGQATINLY